MNRDGNHQPSGSHQEQVGRPQIILALGVVDQVYLACLFDRIESLDGVCPLFFQLTLDVGAYDHGERFRGRVSLCLYLDAQSVANDLLPAFCLYWHGCLVFVDPRKQ